MLHRRIREKRHRLSGTAYQGMVTVAFTAVIHQRIAVFTDRSVVEEFQKILLNEMNRYYCSSPVYLFMPDHLHVILSGDRIESSVIRCMNMFKQKSGFWFSRHRPLYRWQKDYYDHIIRSENELRTQIRYILHNPEKAGLCRHWNQYPHKGSTLFNVNAWKEEIDR